MTTVMEEVVEATEELPEMAETVEIIVKRKPNLKKVGIIGAGFGVGVVIGAAIVKNKDKIKAKLDAKKEARKAKKEEKKAARAAKKEEKKSEEK